MCAIFHGHWLRGDGWMGRGRIDSILSLFPLPILSCFSPSSTTSQFSCCAALSSGGIPSYQTKCIRTFSVQIWKFSWPLCLKFWFQSSKQWRTSCSKDCCHPHKQKSENSKISRWWSKDNRDGNHFRLCSPTSLHQAGNICKCCRAPPPPLICRSGKDGCWGAG